jgi:hypothetical protein
MSDEEKKSIREWAGQVDHLPQSLRESEIEDLKKYNPDNEPGMRRVELIARRTKAGKGPGGLPLKKEREPGEDEEAPF